MKKVIGVLIGVLPLMTVAQDWGDFDPDKMARQAQEMQSCMAKIDQADLERLQADAEQQADEIQSLCKAGKRDAAQAAAIKYGKQLLAEPSMQQLQKCASVVEAMDLPQVGWADLAEGSSNRHVCDLQF